MKEKEEENVSSVERLVTLPGSANRREEEKVVEEEEAEVLATSVEKLVTWQELALRRRGVTR